ncbi:E3 ubiquitin-protein ligase TRIM15-like isoform X2 [Chrysemys picta bellii]|uniref:E3 ubiquitin-protein ligase TRIM15-like isoform X2 n=1 Tax=Chrysemys picta bellii TaxID=8478 RepID=UPI0032B14E48
MTCSQSPLMRFHLLCGPDVTKRLEPVILGFNWKNTHFQEPLKYSDETSKSFLFLQERIQAHLKTLREEREKLLGFKATREGNSREYLKQTQTERQKIVSEFQQLRQFLEEQERLLLAQLDMLDEEIVKIQNENVSKLSEQISHLSELISELEGKCQKPASEFLQDIRSTLSRFEKEQCQQREEISPELEERVSGFSQKNIALLEALRKFKDTLPSELERKRGESFGAHRQGEFAVNVTLDPDTAHPQLVLSEDRKSVKCGNIRQRLPNNPERFDTEPCVLGCEGFTSGRHCWEVEVGDGDLWAVGVARGSVRRKGQISLSPEGGIWAVEWCWGGRFRALTSPVTRLPLSRFPSRIRVCLDCDRGQVTFIDAGDEAPIFTFPPGSIPGERIRPWFWVWGGISAQTLSLRHSRGGNWKSASLLSHTPVSMTVEDSHLPSPWLLISMASGSSSPSLSAALGLQEEQKGPKG